jgi:hypothetical protein
MELSKNFRLRPPREDRKAERALGDEDVAANSLEGSGHSIILGFVVATEDPPLTIRFG